MEEEAAFIKYFNTLSPSEQIRITDQLLALVTNNQSEIDDREAYSERLIQIKARARQIDEKINPSRRGY